MNPQIERAMQAFNTGAWDEAKALCVEQLNRDGHDPDALLVLGHIHAALAETQEAAALLSQARRAAPADARFLSTLGAAYSLVELESDARWAYEAALKIDPEFARGLFGLGDILFRSGEWDTARNLFERAVARNANFAPALAALADMAFRENRDDEARALAARAAAISPNLPAVQLILAEIALSRGLFGDALTAADQVLTTWASNPQQRGFAMSIKGRAFEGLGRFDEAFASFEQSNENMRKSSDQFDRTDNPLSPHRLERIIDFVRGENPTSWPRATAGTSPDPVFLIGFPRSGTTLSGQVLGAHPDIETMEENDSFEDSISALLTQEPLVSWDHLTPAEVGGLRDAYWRRAAQRLGRIPTKPVVIDKMPMNLILLPVIRLLFPSAKILFVVRDPRDVVVSCFKQRFELNRATVHFLSLATTVAYFDVVMRLTDVAQRRLSFDVHELRYERLVTDFDAAIGSVLSFLRVPWSDAVHRYADAARNRRIYTPSARAVTRPIFSSASGAWRKYASQLGPHMPTLDKWAESLGYDAGEGTGARQTSP